MCWLRLSILLLIVSLPRLMAKAESQLFIFPLISNLQSHPGFVTACDVDFLTKTNHLRRLHESAGCSFPWQTWLLCWLLKCFAWQQMSCSDLGKSRQPSLVPTGCRWTGDSFQISMLTEIESSLGAFASHCYSYTNVANYIQGEFRWNQHVPGLSPDEVRTAAQIKWTQKSRQRCFGFILVSKDIYLPVFFFTLEDNRLNISSLSSYVFSICGLWSIPWKSLTRWIQSLPQVIHGSPENPTL